MARKRSSIVAQAHQPSEKKIHQKIEKISNYMELGGKVDGYINRMDATNESGHASILLLKEMRSKNVINFLIIYSWDFFSSVAFAVRHL